MSFDLLLVGDRIYLTPLREEDVHALALWFQDTVSTRLLDSSPAFPKSEPALKKWVWASQRPKRDYVFAIRKVEGDKLIGYLEIDNIIWSHGTCGLSYLVGDPTARGQGFAFEALELALKFIFHELNLYRVSLTIFENNQASIALAEKLGFKKEGIFRNHIKRDGLRFNMLLYGLLLPEWKGT